jgi:hypothetical protein
VLNDEMMKLWSGWLRSRAQKLKNGDPIAVKELVFEFCTLCKQNGGFGNTVFTVTSQ